MMIQVDGCHSEVGFYAGVPEHHKQQQQGYESLKGLQLTCLATTTMITSSTITTTTTTTITKTVKTTPIKRTKTVISHAWQLQQLLTRQNHPRLHRTAIRADLRIQCNLQEMRFVLNLKHFALEMIAN